MQSQTHDLSFTGTEVRKRFLSWADGEADREWRCLRLIWEHAPGVAPRPLRRETADGHPVVIMEQLSGAPQRPEAEALGFGSYENYAAPALVRLRVDHSIVRQMEIVQVSSRNPRVRRHLSAHALPNALADMSHGGSTPKTIVSGAVYTSGSKWLP